MQSMEYGTEFLRTELTTSIIIFHIYETGTQNLVRK